MRQTKFLAFLTLKMHQNGAKFYDWPAPFGQENMVSKDQVILRLVTNFATTPLEIKAFAALTE